MKIKQTSAALALFCWIFQSHAATATFTSESAFTSAVGGIGVTPSVESFESFFPGGGGVSLRFGPFTATEAGPNPGIGFFRSTAFATLGQASLALNLDAGSSVVFQFDTPINVFGVNIHNPLGLQLSFQTDAGDSAALPVTSPSFFGAISPDRAFTRVSLSPTLGSRGEFLAFDELYFAPVPEPSTSALVAVCAVLWIGRTIVRRVKKAGAIKSDSYAA